MESKKVLRPAGQRGDIESGQLPVNKVTKSKGHGAQPLAVEWITRDDEGLQEEPLVPSPRSSDTYVKLAVS